MKKLNKKKGFTLAELLVVVAIIAVLVAISIPIFTSQLNKAKKATNEANLRAAKAAAVSQYLTDENTGSASYIYDLQNGTIKSGVTDGTLVANISDATNQMTYTTITVNVSGTAVTLYAK
jgi:type IV pilus assembly protein PilA